MSLALGRWILNHWTTRELLCVVLLLLLLLFVV